MKSISFKLTVIMLSVILLGISVTITVAMTISGSAITRESLAKIQWNTKSETNNIDGWLSYQKANLSTLADMLSQTGDLSKEQLAPVFNAVIEDNEAYFEVYMGFPDGKAITGSGYEFDYSWWHAYERGWYKLALTDTSTSHITSPYIDAQTEELCITAVHAVLRDGAVIGVVSADIFVTDLQNMTLSSTLDSAGYSMLLDSNGDIIVHPDSDYAPDENGDYRNLNTVMDGVYSDLWRQISVSDESIKYKDAKGTVKYYTADTLSSTGWHFITVLPAEVVSKPITTVIFIVVPLTLLIITFAALLIMFTIRKIIGKPITIIAKTLTQIGINGDLALDPETAGYIKEYIQRSDEVGKTAEAADGIIKHLTMIQNELKYIADGDFTVDIHVLSDRDVIGTSAAKMADNLNVMFEEINSSASQVKSGSNQIATGAQTLAQGSFEQANAVEQLLISFKLITEKTERSVNLAGKAADMSDIITQKAKTGSRRMEEMIMAVKEINDAGQQISKVIKVIDDIAFQTNILALNAAVEAARAGSAGKGFAVVAEEVRNLAAKSAEAAKDTGKLIANSVEKAGLGFRIAGETAASFEEIVTGVDESNKLIMEISESSREQSNEISNINTGIMQVSQVIQQNSAAAQESAAAGEELNGQADIMKVLVGRLKLKKNR